MATEITVTEAARHFSDVVNRVAYGHESFILVRGKRPVAELRPLERVVRVRDLSGVFSGLPMLEAGDGVAFEADIELGRSQGVGVSMKNPWDS